MANKIQLAKDYSIDAIDYAGQGNAILGIRDSGKTYTGTKAAEGLLDAGIPIIVYDPIGIWKNLKIGVGKHKGYPVVIAGGEGSDIKLTPNNAVEIVRAAMKENVSLVIDLYSPELINKSTWIKVVQETVDELMYQNKAYGMRHIFLEEAAEFIPQRLQPQHARVYASLERLARMGRNAHLGMTIINQRSEEVNKAILEIMALCLLHKQVGKNSLTSIKKWLDIRGYAGTNVDVIMKDLPTLQKGECYVIGEGAPKFIKVLQKNTFHPDPKKPVDPVISKLAVNVLAFVEKMNDQLAKEAEKKSPKKAIAQTKPAVSLPTAKEANQISKLQEQNRELQVRNGQLLAEIREKERSVTALKKAIQVLEERATDTCERIVKMAYTLQNAHGIKIPEPGQNAAETVSKTHNNVQKTISSVPKRPIAVSTGNGSLGKCSREIIRFLAQYEDREFTKAQVGIATGYSTGSGGFNNSLGELNQRGFIIRDGKLRVNRDAMGQIIESVGQIVPQEYNIETYKSNLGKCEREIYEVLLNHPEQSFTKEELSMATETKYSHDSGGFNNSLGRLNTLELIHRDRGQIKLNPELLELM
jgi:hypothetical protein